MTQRQLCVVFFLYCVFIAGAMIAMGDEPKAQPMPRGDGITVYGGANCPPCQVYKVTVLNPLKAQGYRIRYIDYDSLGPKDWKPDMIPCTVFFKGSTQLGKPLYGIIPKSVIKERITLPTLLPPSPPPSEKRRGPIKGIINATRQMLR